MDKPFDAYYFDGKRASKYEVTVSVVSSGIRITGADGNFTEWYFGDFIQTSGLFENEPLKLERKSPNFPGEALVLKDKSFLDYLINFVPSKHRSDFETRKKFKKMVVFIPVGAILSVILLLVINYYVIPETSEYIADQITPEYEIKMGKETFNLMTKYSNLCTNTELNKVLNDMVKTFEGTLENNPYEFEVHIIESDTLNAYALPGGQMAFYSGLIERTESPEQLAGVLAHEMQHVLKKHSTRHMVRQNLISFISTVLFGGDYSSLTEAAVTFAELEYSRDLETESDEGGARLMAAAEMDINEMAAFFDVMTKEENIATGGVTDADFFEYISTHPLSKNRSENIRSIAMEYNYKPKNHFKNVKWGDVKMMCKPSKEDYEDHDDEFEE